MTISKAVSFLSSKSSDLIKGLILICWYAVLIYSVAIAHEGKASSSIANLYKTLSYDRPVSSLRTEDFLIKSPLDFLYFGYESTYPENIIVILLNKLIPPWSQTESLSSDFKDKYYVLLITIEAYLKTIVENADHDLKGSIRAKEIVPHSFHEYIQPEEELFLPSSIQSWALSERNYLKDSQARQHLADTFLILIILGTFGSLIFLTKDYIDNEKDRNTNIASYVFRPLFGMALAMAMFIVDMVAHSIISTGGIENIRNETMYLLGLSSGLLAEKAYDILQRKAREGLEGEES